MYKACPENERKQPDWLVLASLDMNTSGTYRRSDARTDRKPVHGPYILQQLQ